jgi:predicted amidohydrolase
MKLAVAQTRPVKGNIEKNIEVHKKLIELAAAYAVDLIVFPELSLTGYEPTLAKQLATTPDDKRLNVFQSLTNEKNLIIAIGLPTIGVNGIHISMIIFQPNQKTKIYSKQILHKDEYPFFVPGTANLMLTFANKKIAPAICYESLQPEHAATAAINGANIYLASVAKSANGVDKAYRHYPEIARNHSMLVLMSNCVGACDDFEATGQSAIWNEEGKRLGQLNDKEEGILIIDTNTAELIKSDLLSR